MHARGTAVRGVLGVTLTILSLCAVDTAGTWLIQESALEAVREKGTIASIQGWAELLADPVRSEDWDDVANVVSCALRDDRILQIQVQDARGRERYRLGRAPLIASERPLGRPAGDDGPWSGGVGRAEPERAVHVPIVQVERASGSQVMAQRVAPAVGFLVVELARKDGDPVVRAARQRVMVLGVVLAVGAGFLLWWVHNIHQGIGKLARVASSLVDDGTGHPVDARVPHSWQPLVSAIHDLGGELARRREQLDNIDKEMEERVAMRTQKLRNVAIRDPLTGMYNRRYLDEVLRQHAAEAARYGSDLSVLMIDLDDLKRVNDTFGHQVGDQALRFLALTIACELREADVAGRYGGDEFTVVLPRTGVREAEAIARRICERYRSVCAERLPQANTTLSAGVAGAGDEHARDAEDLIHSADAALYQAKSAGKGQVARFGASDRSPAAGAQATSTIGPGF